MSGASRPDRGLRAPRSSMSVSSTSTPPQAPPAGDATPPAPASADAEHCCVCLERLLPAAQAQYLRDQPCPFSPSSLSLTASGPPDKALPLAPPARPMSISAFSWTTRRTRACCMAPPAGSPMQQPPPLCLKVSGSDASSLRKPNGRVRTLVVGDVM